jgi:hypothetical protein
LSEERIVAHYMSAEADDHNYEAEDAFLHYGGEDVKHYTRWDSEGRRRYMPPSSTMIEVANTGVPNLPSNPIARAVLP